MNKKNLTIIAAALTALIFFLSVTRKRGFKNKIAELAKQEFKNWHSVPLKKETQKQYNVYAIIGNKALTRTKVITTILIPHGVPHLLLHYEKSRSGNQFKYKTLHRDYINAAKQNRKNNVKTFQAFRKKQMPVTVWGSYLLSTNGRRYI